ncbi:MAG: 2-phosphosulfolactate phosphatase, partial [Alicyclobacillaceae bacterium]|nr:2-phosphosulfolactate phosphatase [Alicyclobacillaceae bacterium]
GARRVFPAADLEEARSLTRMWASCHPVTGGEEDGRPIPGFDLGPCPEEYTEDTVGGRDVVFLTTNGTRAVRKAEAAKELLVASLRNAPAVAEYLEERGAEAVYLICAGSKGRVSLEDALCAGLIASRLDGSRWALDDAALLARDFARAHGDRIVECLAQSRVGRWFAANGRQETLAFVGAVGASSCLIRVEDGQLHRIR